MFSVNTGITVGMIKTVNTKENIAEVHLGPLVKFGNIGFQEISIIIGD